MSITRFLCHRFHLNFHIISGTFLFVYVYFCVILIKYILRSASDTTMLPSLETESSSQKLFERNCSLSGKEVLSAINRSTSEYCVRAIRNAYCAVKADDLYPLELPNTCNYNDFNPRTIAEMSENGNRSAYNEPSAIRIMFVLCVNGRDVRQVKRLLKILYHRNHFFYIHVDKRHDYMFRKLKHLEKQFENIILTRQRYSTIWGGSTLLTMLLNSMKEVLQPNYLWDYFINLSESDYPIKSDERLKLFLEKHRNFNFAKSHGRDAQYFTKKQGLDQAFIECDHRMWRIGKKPFPKGIIFDGGSDWVALSRRFVQYLVRARSDAFLDGLVKFYKYTLLPAESFFHTVLRNSAFCNTYVNNNLRTTNWKRERGCNCQHRHVVDWCGCSPNNYLERDFAKLKNTDDKAVFFARKFEPVVSQSIILKLEEWLYGRRKYHETDHSLRSHWLNCYHYKDAPTRRNTPLLEVVSFLAKNALKSIIDANEVNILQIHSFHEFDKYKGSSIHFTVTESSTEEEYEFEIFTSPSFNFHIRRQTDIANRLLHLSVNINFDLKELLSRDFLNFIASSDEDLFAISHWSAGRESYNVTVLWVDPLGNIANVNVIDVDTKPAVRHVKFHFKYGFIPGIWRVYLLYADEIFADINFVIFPSEITTYKREIIPVLKNYPASHNLWKHLLRDSSDLIELDSNKESQKRDLNLYSEYFDYTLITRYYNNNDICLLKFPKYNELVLPSCHQTYWSSFYPDPKSQLTDINANTGRFNW